MQENGAAPPPAPSFIHGVIKREARKLTDEIEHVHAQSGPETQKVREEKKALPINPAGVSGGFNSAQNKSPTRMEETGSPQAREENTQRSPEEVTRAKVGLSLESRLDASQRRLQEYGAEMAISKRDRFMKARSELAALHGTAGKMLRSVEANELQIREMAARKPINPNKSLIRVPPKWHVEEEGGSHNMFSLSGLQEAERRLHMAKASGNGSEVAKWLVCVAELYEYSGKYSEALELCEQCSQNELVLSADGEIGRVMLMAQFRQGLVGLKMGDIAMAIAVLEDCFYVASSQFDVPGLCLMQLNLCHLYLVQHSTISASSPQQTEEQSVANDHRLISRNRKMAADKERMLAAAQTLMSDYR